MSAWERHKQAMEVEPWQWKLVWIPLIVGAYCVGLYVGVEWLA